MAENSKIEWTHHTFNPWVGCTKISPACDNCYAEEWDKRYEGGKHWGAKAERRRTSEKNWNMPLKWNSVAERYGVRLRVFCASLADVFDNQVPEEWRVDLFNLIRATPELDWLLLTKRPQNIAKMLPPDWGDGYKNVWLGTTVENQMEADRRIPHLLKVSATVRFLSCEPLLGHLDLSHWVPQKNFYMARCKECLFHESSEFFNGDEDSGPDCPKCFSQDVECDAPCIDWVITGGESGSHHRHSDPEWFRSLRDQCVASGVSFLFKQWGGKTSADIKKLGRELDGVVWDQYPEESK